MFCRAALRLAAQNIQTFFEGGAGMIPGSLLRLYGEAEPLKGS